MTEIIEKAKRPISITIICVIGFVATVYSVFLVFSPRISAVASWYPLYFGLSDVIGLVCYIGLWLMKKWAAYALAVMAVVGLVVPFLATGAWNVVVILISVVIIFFVLKDVSKMT